KTQRSESRPSILSEICVSRRACLFDERTGNQLREGPRVLSLRRDSGSRFKRGDHTHRYGCTLIRNASVSPPKVVLPFTAVTAPAGVTAATAGSVPLPAGTPRNVPLGRLATVVALANV